MFKEREVPRILFHESLLSAPFKVSVNPFNVTEVLRVAGVKGTSLKDIKILLANKSPKSDRGGYFNRLQKTIVLFPGEIDTSNFESEKLAKEWITINLVLMLKHETKHASDYLSRLFGLKRLFWRGSLSQKLEKRAKAFALSHTKLIYPIFTVK